ncbi:MAG: PspA/IM30 family protein [bacterium]
MFQWLGLTFRRLGAWLTGSVDEVIPDSAKLEVEAQRMVSQLQVQRDAVTMAMAQALNGKEKLQQRVEAMARGDGMAKDYIRQGREDLAARVIENQEAMKQEIEMLTSQYEQLQAAAESAVLQYRENERRVKEALRKLDNLKLQSRLNEIRESVQKSLSSFDLNAPLKSFERIEEKIELKTTQLQADSMLAAGGLEGMKKDAEIAATERSRVIEKRILELKRQMEESGGVVQSEAADETMDRARKALSAPAFGFLLTPGTREPEPAAVFEEGPEKRKG